MLERIGKLEQANLILTRKAARLYVGGNGEASVDVMDLGGDPHPRLRMDQQGNQTALEMRDIKDVRRTKLGIDGPRPGQAGLIVDAKSF
jgi:hypothetical protein